MPKSPLVKFKVENNNLEITTPTPGISCVLAVTQKGPYKDPSTIVTSVTKFKELFGSEMVPDGTPSNIEKALKGGSRLRIVRVPGNGYYEGVLTKYNDDTYPSDPDEVEADPKKNPVLTLVVAGTRKCEIGFYTTVGENMVDGADTMQVLFEKVGNTVWCRVGGKGNTNYIENTPVITYKGTSKSVVVDYLALSNFLNGASEYLKPVFISATGMTGVTSLESLITYLRDNVDGKKYSFDIQIAEDPIATSKPLIALKGSNGTAPTKAEWIAALESVRDYTDFYQIACSHLDQHLSSTADQLEVHTAAATMADELDEYIYFIEVPKYTTHYSQGTVVRDKSSIISWIASAMGTIGNSRNVAYFAGGIKYNDSNGLLVNSDLLGTILGLADNSGSTYGPWKSYAGMNRGVIYDGNGPVSPNYGSPSRYDDLNELANAYANMIVVKNTSGSGQRTMLWHNFTSQIKQDSFRFISIVNLIHYLKKNIRPILDAHIEEPNYIPTWQSIYFQVKPILDTLVNQEAISEYAWAGDQNATSYADMTVNKEADVRQGRYKAILTFKDIVPLQDIELSLVIDKTTSTVALSVNE